MTLSRFQVLLALVAAAVALPARAFHSGGVADCEGCHTMHNSLESQPMGPGGGGQYAAGPYLLRGSDQSSTCLECHEGNQDGNTQSYHVATPVASMPDGTPPNNLTPGGDFGWLRKTYTWVPRSGAAAETSKAERHGHNVVAGDFGYVADLANTLAPGADTFQYPAAQLHCSSCHDPHGKYRLNANNGVFTTTGKPIYTSGSYGALPTTWGAVGAYRILGGVNYFPKSMGASFAFSKGNPIIAVAPEAYNRPETGGADQVRVAYGRSVSLWCANCHAQMHSTFGSIVHPADQNLGSEVTGHYNQYRKSGDLSGTVASSYTSLVPYQNDNAINITTLVGVTTTTSGPISTDRVMCLSCHRAHASGFDSMMRFGLGNEFMTVADANGNPLWPDPATNPAQAQGRTTAETQTSYYGRPPTAFAPYQRVLCNKCHAKD